MEKNNITLSCISCHIATSPNVYPVLARHGKCYLYLLSEKKTNFVVTAQCFRFQICEGLFVTTLNIQKHLK